MTRTLLQDLWYALRMMRKNLGSSVAIMLSLAIGIGANTAIFSVIDALLLHPLPYPQPERLAAIWLHSPGIGIFRDWPSPGQYIDLQNENHSFDLTALAQSRSATLTGRDQPERITIMKTQSSLLTMLGAQTRIGHLLLPEDDRPGKAPVAVLTERVWKRLFSTDPNIIGKAITLNGTQYTVVGVLRPEFLLNNEVMPSEGPMDNVDAILPLPLGPDAVQKRGDENYNIMVRLKPGVTLQQAREDVNAIANRIREKDKRGSTFGMHIVGLQEQVVGDVRRVLLVLLGSVAVVLLIACANVANLLLTRASARAKEIAVRTALGARWQRLVRQLLTESVLLSLLGGTAGLTIAAWSLHVVHTIKPGNIPRMDEIGISGTVLLFTFGISLITGILFGLAPAWRAIKVDLNTTLKAGGRGGHGETGLRISRHQLRGLLVVSELALSLIKAEHNDRSRSRWRHIIRMIDQKQRRERIDRWKPRHHTPEIPVAEPIMHDVECVEITGLPPEELEDVDQLQADRDGHRIAKLTVFRDLLSGTRQQDHRPAHHREPADHDLLEVDPEYSGMQLHAPIEIPN
ncbi:MAG TPA: ABC transporter permease [Candidatus Angelobacter sp.]